MLPSCTSCNSTPCICAYTLSVPSGGSLSRTVVEGGEIVTYDSFGKVRSRIGAWSGGPSTTTISGGKIAAGSIYAGTLKIGNAWAEWTPFDQYNPPEEGNYLVAFNQGGEPNWTAAYYARGKWQNLNADVTHYIKVELPK